MGLSPSAEPNCEITLCRTFPCKIAYLAADDGLVWVVTEPSKENSETYCTVYRCNQEKMSGFRVKLSESSLIQQCIADRRNCLLVVSQPIKTSGRAHFIPDTVKSSTSLLYTDGTTVRIFRTPFSCLRKLLRLPSGSFLAVDAGKWILFELSDEGISSQRVLARTIHDGYDEILGVWSNYLILASASGTYGCLFDIESNEILCSFPLPHGVREAGCVGQTIYFTGAAGSEIVKANLCGL